MIKDLTGLEFGLLTVDGFSHIDKKRRSYWLCCCECGNKTVVRKDCLTTGNTKSCGCFNSKCRIKPNSNRKHKLYRVYYSMRERCHNPNDKQYFNYGARGIKLCDEWLSSYDAFYEWALSHGYKEGLTIDRRDNNQGYSPDNCRWITQAEQTNNTRRNKWITFNGKTLNIEQWAKEININPVTLWHRLNSLNWSVERALTTPVANKV